jgi:phosphoribosyl 1,2-cyclic phosphodiesterase
VIARELPDYQGWKVFNTGEAFELGDLLIESFPLPHDASDPVGFLIHAGSQKVAFVTDLGYVPKLIVERIKDADVMILETNHDVDMLRNDTHRPWSVKQRILSRHGHLSNEAAASAIPEIVSDRLKRLFLAHLSRGCNEPDLARQTIQARLDKLGARHVHLEVAEQHDPGETLTW